MTVPIRIARAEVTPYSVTLPRPLKSAAGCWDTRSGALLRLTDEDGRCGVGEACPLPGISSETAAEATAALTDVAARLDGRSFDGDVYIHHLTSGAAPDDVYVHRDEALAGLGDVCIHHLPASAQFALESAMADLAGQVSGLPVAAMLAGGRTLGRRVPVCGLIGLAGDEDDRHAQACALVERGFSTLKIKITGDHLADDLAVVRRIRTSFPDLGIRVDANGSLGIASAREALIELASLTVEMVEDPVPAHAMASLAPSPVALAVDLSREGDGPAMLPNALLAPWMRAPDLAAVVVKPARIGGLGRTLAIAREAESRGVHTIVSHLLDGPVAMAAYAALASQFSGPACGLGPHPGLLPWTASVPHHRGPFIDPSPAPGLGVAW